MNNEPRQALREIIAKYGTDICSNARRCEGLLKDYSGSHRRETNILVNALKERVPLDLLAAGSSQPRELLLNRLAKRLEENIALTEEASNWAVEAWALALNLISESEIREREIKRAKAKLESAQPKTVSSVENRAEKFPDMSVDPQLAPRKQPSVKNKPNKAIPINQPPIFAAPPDLSAQTNGQSIPPIAPVPTADNSPQTTQKTEPNVQTRPKKRSWKIRGCFIGCLLILIFLAVLLFGVPYAFKVMRETQQPQSQPQFPPP